jgi:hypothetical protein
MTRWKMPRKSINLAFPAAGVVRRFGLNQTPDIQGPPGTQYALNCRLEDSIAHRFRGGSFVGQSFSEADVPRYRYLTTPNGDRIVTGDGSPIIIGPQYGVTSGDDVVWLAPGDDAPSTGTADCLYRDRLFRTSTNIIMCSRQGKYTEWDYGGELEDHGRAMVLQLAEAGEAGVTVVAMVPHKDAYLLCFSASEIWVLSGDPTTGTLRNISREVGIISARAFCKNHDTIYFLSSRGLYSVQADGSGLKAISEDKAPVELSSITDAAALVSYYHADHGVYIHMTTAPSWFYDTVHDNFFPFDTTHANSHVLIGPFRLGEGNKSGRVLNMHGTMALGSGTVTWSRAC